MLLRTISLPGNRRNTAARRGFLSFVLLTCCVFFSATALAGQYSSCSNCKGTVVVSGDSYKFWCNGKISSHYTQHDGKFQPVCQLLNCSKDASGSWSNSTSQYNCTVIKQPEKGPWLMSGQSYTFKGTKGTEGQAAAANLATAHKPYLCVTAGGHASGAGGDHYGAKCANLTAQCSIDDITIDHGNVEKSKFAGNVAKGTGHLTCNHDTTVTLRLSSNPVSLSNGGKSTLSFDNGNKVTAVADVVSDVTVTSTLSGSNPAVGAFTGNTVLMMAYN